MTDPERESRPERSGRPWLFSKSHLWFSPVVFALYRTYDVLRQSSAACKALKVLKTTVLKRLASAVCIGRRCEQQPSSIFNFIHNWA